ncbi:MAG: redoxin domain-containing protein, partial [bacterium]
MIRQKFFIAGILTALAVLGFGSAGLTAEAKLALGGPAPNFKLKSNEGKRVDLRRFRGKSTVILAFWLPDYAPVLEELEKLRSILKEKRFRDVRVLTITRGKNEKEKKDAIDAFKKHKLDFPILWDEDYKVSLAYEFYRPGFFVINKDGNLASTLMSSVAFQIRDMTFEEILEKIVAGEKVDILQFHPRAGVDPYGKMLGKRLPDFRLKDLDGVDQAPAFYRGFKKIVVVFW